MIFQILIVDDEPHVVDAIRGILEQEPAVDMEIHTAFRGQQALKMCQQYPIQLLITDIRMPDMSGLELLRRLRKEKQIPVILVTARDAVMDKVTGLDMGADDYITKPFEIEELLARIQVHLRQSTSAQAETPEVAGLRLLPQSQAVLAGGQEVHLTRTEYAILKLLLQNPGQVIAKSVILDRISADTP